MTTSSGLGLLLARTGFRHTYSRKEMRFAVDASADVRMLTGPALTFGGRVVNVSANGCAIEVLTHVDIGVGTRMDVSFGDTVVTAEVRHVTAGTERTLIGARILELRNR